MMRQLPWLLADVEALNVEAVVGPAEHGHLMRGLWWQCLGSESGDFVSRHDHTVGTRCIDAVHGMPALDAVHGMPALCLFVLSDGSRDSGYRRAGVCSGQAAYGHMYCSRR